MKEIFQLKPKDRKTLIEEIAVASEVLHKTYWPDKINIAALGNQVEQLHIHIIARFKTDDAWPEPIWGKGTAPYDPECVMEVVSKFSEACRDIKGFTHHVANNI